MCSDPTPPTTLGRRFDGDTLAIASHNPGKVREIADLLGRYVTRFPSASELGVSEPEETETTFRGNAELKARHVMAASGLPALADDSGLAVTQLGGAPGVYSARWALGDDGIRDFSRAMERVHEALEAALDGRSGDRTATFVCALSLCWPDGHVETVEGTVHGHLVWPPRGARGFGYDPMFVPDGHDLSFGEMDPEAKHAISHRARAFEGLVARCFG